MFCNHNIFENIKLYQHVPDKKHIIPSQNATNTRKRASDVCLPTAACRTVLYTPLYLLLSIPGFSRGRTDLSLNVAVGYWSICFSWKEVGLLYELLLTLISFAIITCQKFLFLFITILPTKFHCFTDGSEHKMHHISTQLGRLGLSPKLP